MLKGAGDSPTWKVYWLLVFVGFLVYWCLVSWFLGFKVSWFQSPKSFFVSMFQSLKDALIPYYQHLFPGPKFKVSKQMKTDLHHLSVTALPDKSTFLDFRNREIHINHIFENGSRFFLNYLRYPGVSKDT